MRRILSRRIMPDTPPVENKDYLCVEFSGTGVGDIRTVSDSPGTDDTKPYYMKYLMMSKDGIHWENTTRMQVPAGGKVYIKGKGTSFYNPSTRKGWRFNIDTVWHSGSTDKVYATLSGNIMSLLYDDDFEDKTEVGNYAFYMLFFGETNNRSIVDVSRLKLPATTVGQYAYASMFQANNQGAYAHPFTKPPKLPATTLGAHCYENMFAYSRLDEMPDLPATTLAEGCYQNMFAHCSIKEAKILPATTFATNCYAYMFGGQKTNMHIPHNMLPATTLISGCYSTMFKDAAITDIPSDLLPATTLASYCYKSMFEGCTALTYIPDRLLPATTLAVDCYMNMFKGCTRLTKVPRNLLPATTLADDCYQSMFEGCTSLASLPYGLLPAMTMVNYSYKTMFKDCTSLRNIPGNLLPATALSARCYESMFEGCSSLLNVPSVLPAANVDTAAYQNMFKGCSSITEIPKGFLHATYINAGGCQNMFEGCSGLTEIGSPLLIENTRLSGLALGQMFKRCTALVNVDKGLLPTSNFIGSQVYFGMFQECDHLTNTIAFGPTVYTSCYESMYEGCTALTDFEELPATTLANSCYKAMFKGTGITTLSGKHLPAEQTSLAISSVYQSMFESCESLTFVPDDFIGLKNFQTQYCCKRMFAGCKKLSEAPYFNPTNLSAGSHAFEEMYAGCYGEETVNGETVYTGLTRMRPIGSNTSARLPFTNAGQLAFASMFSGCRLMTEIPIIDVEYLEGTGVFEYMYYGCTALEAIPSGMFAKVLKKQSGISDASSFAMNMFEGCTSLDSTKIPSDLISNQTIEDGGYEAMFKGCNSLETPIALPSVSNSYNYMYQNCINLTSIATMNPNVAGYYRYMYQGCTGLITVNNLPNLTSTSIKIKDFTGFFKGCTKLTSVNNISGTDVQCAEMFSGCKSLTSISLNLTFTETDANYAGSCYSMFSNCSTTTVVEGVTTYSGLTSVSGSITVNSFANELVQGYGQFATMFDKCRALTTLPTFTINTNTAGAHCYESMFLDCNSLSNVVKSLTQDITTLAEMCYRFMYGNCVNITTIPTGTLPATTAASSCYTYMFSSSGITEVKDGNIAITTLAANCCKQMFYNCKSLTKAYTPATTEPVSDCYNQMFNRCTNLAEVHCMLNIQNKQTTYTGSWLYGVAQTGKFYARSGSDWARNANGIPEGWTVEYVNA